ncbi:MAG: FkbM family methyltransferase [Myxococcota bacterium]|nr:FkbM family methyltransferase [Myxococcota bacterium]
MSISIPPHLQSEPWSSILWADVQQYISLLNRHAPPQPKPFVVDVGANIGFAAIVFHLAYHADVLSIEAIPQTYLSLQKNCAPYPRIATIQTAVASKEGSVTLYDYPLARGLGGLDEPRFQIWLDLLRGGWQKQSSVSLLVRPIHWIGMIFWALFAVLIVVFRKPITVSTRTLSQILSDHPDRTIDVLKIDIEGHELSALHGLNPADWSRVRTLIIELHPEHKDKILKLLQENQFSVLAEEYGQVYSHNTPSVLLAQNLTLASVHTHTEGSY